MKEKMVGGLPMSMWETAFAEAVRIAIEQDYFSDTLFYYLYPEAEYDEETGYNEYWNYTKEAFKEFFDIEY